MIVIPCSLQSVLYHSRVRMSMFMSARQKMHSVHFPSGEVLHFQTDASNRSLPAQQVRHHA